MGPFRKIETLKELVKQTLEQFSDGDIVGLRLTIDVGEEEHKIGIGTLLNAEE